MQKNANIFGNGGAGRLESGQVCLKIEIQSGERTRRRVRRSAPSPTALGRLAGEIRGVSQTSCVLLFAARRRELHAWARALPIFQACPNLLSGLFNFIELRRAIREGGLVGARTARDDRASDSRESAVQSGRA